MEITELNNTTPKVRNSMARYSSRLDTAEEKTSEQKGLKRANRRKHGRTKNGEYRKVDKRHGIYNEKANIHISGGTKNRIGKELDRSHI